MNAHTQMGGENLKGLNSPLPWLFLKLSYQIKSSHIARRSKAHSKVRPAYHPQSMAGLRWFVCMASHMDAAGLEQFLAHVLTPVYRLTEDDMIRDSQMGMFFFTLPTKWLSLTKFTKELEATAIELQDLVQSKVGTTKFANVYNQIQQSVLGLRKE